MQIIDGNRSDFDAVIVGSGATGGWAAKQLTEAGLKVAVLEAGSPVTPQDFSEHVQSYETKYRFLSKTFMRDRPTQRQNYACQETNYKWFANDVENPYSHPDDKPFSWFRLRALGGRSLAWGRGVFRHSDLDFKAASRDGWGIDWPITAAEMETHYETVERFIGCSGTAEGQAALPDSIFQPPLGLRCGERRLKDGVMKKFGRVITDGRSAVLTRPLNGRQACHHCGPCHRGCATNSYFSSPFTTLAAAQRTGNLTVLTDSVVSHVVTDPNSDRVRGVAYFDRFTREAREVRAKIVILGASTLESTRILMNSAPSGLGNGSGALGHYLMDHMMVSVRGQVPMEKSEARWTGAPNSPNHIVGIRFRNVDRTETNGFLRGYHMTGSSRPTFRQSSPGFGADYKRRVRDDAYWSMGLNAFIEHLPRYENHVTLDHNRVDAWGIPTLRVSCSYGENERLMSKDAQIEIAGMLEAGGCKNVAREGWSESTPGYAIHEVGTARMGDRPGNSVLNKYCQAWEAPNLFVVDGAAWPTSACQNPTLTLMANAVRVSEYIVDQGKQGAFA